MNWQTHATLVRHPVTCYKQRTWEHANTTTVLLSSSTLLPLPRLTAQYSTRPNLRRHSFLKWCDATTMLTKSMIRCGELPAINELSLRVSIRCCVRFVQIEYIYIYIYIYLTAHETARCVVISYLISRHVIPCKVRRCQWRSVHHFSVMIFKLHIRARISNLTNYA